MADVALCRYACASCGTELEDEGILLLDAANPADGTLIKQLIEGNLNTVACSTCGYANTLPLPFFYHDPAQSLLVGYVPNAGQMSQAELADALNTPMSVVLGALLPEAEKGRLEEYQRRFQDIPADVEMVPVNEEAERAMVEEAARKAALDATSAPTIDPQTGESVELNVPQYLLQPTLVDNLEIVRAMLVAVRDGMSAEEMMADLQRLQFLNALIAEPDPLARRRVLKHNEALINDQIFVVIDTIKEQAVEQNNVPVIDHLTRSRADIERYQQSMVKHDAAAAALWAKKSARPATPPAE